MEAHRALVRELTSANTRLAVALAGLDRTPGAGPAAELVRIALDQLRGTYPHLHVIERALSAREAA